MGYRNEGSYSQSVSTYQYVPVSWIESPKVVGKTLIIKNHSNLASLNPTVSPQTEHRTTLSLVCYDSLIKQFVSIEELPIFMDVADLMGGDVHNLIFSI